MSKKFKELVIAIIGLVIAIMGMSVCLNDTVQSGIFRTAFVFFSIMLVFFLLEIISSGWENRKSRLIVRIITGSLFIFWIGTFFLSTALFHNTEFFSSMMGYYSIRAGNCDSVMVSDKFKINIFSHEEYTYLIAKGKEDEEIPNIVKKHFGETTMIDGHKIYAEEQLKGFVSTYEKDDYTIIVLV